MFAIHRGLLESLAKRPDMPFLADGFYPFFYPMVKGDGELPVYLADVHAFCERAREQGFEAFVNPAVRARRMSRSPQPVDVFSRGDSGGMPAQAVDLGALGPRLLD